MKYPLLIISLGLLLLAACDNNETFDENQEPAPIGLKGTGNFLYDEYTPLADKPIRVFYHVPEEAHEATPLVMVFHGGNRDAQESRDELIAQANREKVILIVPEFSNNHFPGGDAYNLGNVFDDGDNPSAAGLNPEAEWTFSYIEPLFDYCKTLTLSEKNQYHALGFSAGAQFLHRFLLFKPNARVQQAVAAAAGWYTIPDTQVVFPYGVKQAPVSPTDLDAFMARNLVVLVGDRDNDPNAASLRRNAQADQQGDNRYDRGIYFVKQGRAIAGASQQPFAWKFQSLPGVGHDFEALGAYALANLFDY